MRLHPVVSTRLNELAIADFLVFSLPLDPTGTSYADIQRLGSGCCLIASKSKLEVKRYWELPIKPILRYRRTRDYIEHFKELLFIAVSDRLRTQRVAVRMSGGLDSPAVAATAVDVLKKQFTEFEIRAHTIVYDHLIPDDERYYSGLVARALGIPIHYLVADCYTVYGGRQELSPLMPEPCYDLLARMGQDFFRKMAERNRVALSGLGAEPAIDYSPEYAKGLIRDLRFVRFLLDASRGFLAYKCLPPLGIRTALRRWVGAYPQEAPPDVLPVWLRDSLVKRLELDRRWYCEVNKKISSPHPWRPQAYNELNSPGMGFVFDEDDPGVTRLPLEHRHPFFDLRVVNYLLSIPAMPWCMDKGLLRSSMYGTLPDEVVRRPKTWLRVNPVHVRLAKRKPSLSASEVSPELLEYIKVECVSLEKSRNIDTDMRPLSLNYWLQTYEAQPLGEGNELE